ncbi:MAG: endonuclease III [candidate division WOR-3 bacterium]
MSKSSEKLLKFLSVLEDLYPSLSERDAPIKLMHRVKGKDPYRALITTMLSPRVKDELTYRVAQELFKRAPTPYHLARMKLSEIEGILKPLGLYKQKARNIKLAAEKIVKGYNGKVPDSLDELLKFRGVGRKVANIVLSVAFGKPAIAVDTHVFRIIKDRWKLLESAKKPEDVEKFLMENLPKEKWSVVNKLLVAFGQAICKPKNPKCEICPLSEYCPYHSAKGKDIGKVR